MNKLYKKPIKSRKDARALLDELRQAGLVFYPDEDATKLEYFRPKEGKKLNKRMRECEEFLDPVYYLQNGAVNKFQKWMNNFLFGLVTYTVLIVVLGLLGYGCVRLNKHMSEYERNKSPAQRDYDERMREFRDY